MPTFNFISLKPEVELATVSGICPMCDVYIAKSRSWIMKLHRPLTPRYSRYNYYRGTCNDDYPRWYVHERCYPAAIKALDQEDD